jgi:aryl-alcohol dehydrogenase-like predicted oxidoreductase
LLARPWSTENAASLRAKTDVTQTRLLPRDDAVNKIIIGVVERIAEERNLSMAVVSAAWCLHKGVNPIVGLNSKRRIDEAVEAVKVTLTAEEVGRLEAAYVPRNVMGH